MLFNKCQPEGAEALGLVTPDKRRTGVLFRLADGTYVEGNLGEIRSLPQRAVEKAIAAADQIVSPKRKPPRRKPLRR